MKKSLWFDLLRVVTVIIVALILGFIITLLVSKEPVKAYSALLTGPFPKISFAHGFQIRGINRFADWMAESTTLILLGLAVSIVFRANQFSLGAEGQMFLGALIAGIISLHVSAPQPLHILLVLLAAGAVGFLWGLIPGVLKAYLNVNEIVSTLMLNVLAVQLYDLLLINWLRDPQAGFIGTVIFPDSAIFPRLIADTRLSIALIFALVAIVVVWFLIERTPFGYEIRMIGANIRFAEYGGINTKRVIAMSMAVSGILAGIAGTHLSNGLLKSLQIGISQGLGFEGIVVALLARNDPRAILLTGLFYGYLRTGAQIMERSSDVTREVVLIIQAIIILLITAERLLPALQKWRAQQVLEEE
jgi:simple sugar transport system permease protein